MAHPLVGVVHDRARARRTPVRPNQTTRS